jgi:hypothetical protein
VNTQLPSPTAPAPSLRRYRPRAVVVAVVVVVALAVLVGWVVRGDVWGRSGDAVATSTPAGDAAPLPATLAGLTRTAMVTGAPARQQVEQLHGTVLGAGLDSAWVAEYGGAQATVWVSRSGRQVDAQQLLDRMTARIEQAVAEDRSPFTAPVVADVEGVAVYQLDGMGQRHGYFLIGSDLYWVAMPPGLAARGMSELVAAAK